MAEAADVVAFQRLIASLVLDQIGSAGFALAGSSAIREHGITDRPTHDIDLFTTATIGADAFADAVTRAEQHLRKHGYRVTRTRSTPEFARLLVEAGKDGVLEVDFGIDWRAEPPAQLAVGPVLAVSDAVGSKVAAVYSRGEVRDFLDLDAIRQSGRFTDRELLTLAHEHDPGFDVPTFSRQLRRITSFGYVETLEYGIGADQFDQIQQRTLAWADQLIQPATARPDTAVRAAGPDVGPDSESVDARATERLRREARENRPRLDPPSHRQDGPEPPSL